MIRGSLLEPGIAWLGIEAKSAGPGHRRMPRNHGLDDGITSVRFGVELIIFVFVVFLEVGIHHFVDVLGAGLE